MSSVFSTVVLIGDTVNEQPNIDAAIADKAKKNYVDQENSKQDTAIDKY